MLLPPIDSGQFTSWAFTDRAKQSGQVPSMGSIGDCYDNAMIESSWARMQTDLLNRKKWRTRIELASAIFDYLKIFYKPPARNAVNHGQRVVGVGFEQICQRFALLLASRLAKWGIILAAVCGTC